VIRPQRSGPWRLHVDIRDGAAVVRPEEDLDQLVAQLLAADLPVCLVDLDGSRSGTGPGSAAHRLVARWPGRFWIAGGLDGERALAWLEQGAAGAVLGSALLRQGRPERGQLDALRAATRHGRVMISLDSRDGEVVTHAFTRRTGIPVERVVSEIIEVVGSDWELLWVDAAASERAGPRRWEAATAQAALYPDLQVWYGGGLTRWSEVETLWSRGLGAVVGRAHLEGALGLPA
jgi:phosphoribosylformimino-5-aminoimidazole carboxamide ribonucleotide (ProFAR) isomerase